MDACPLRVLELYSGIGGMHFALQGTKVAHDVVASVDINPLAKEVYKLNFPQTKYWERNIEGLKAAELDKLKLDMILMSPPCQPFTRIGLKKDIADPRTRSFLHVLDILGEMTNLPSFILLENVKGFEESKTHEILCEKLKSLNYSWKGFLVSPKHLGIPNSRLRYFMLAKCCDKHWDNLPKLLEGLECKEHMDDSGKTNIGNIANPQQHCQAIRAYLTEEEDSSKLKVPEQVVERYLPIMDIVSPDSLGSTCFTKSYGKYVEGTGSILNISGEDENVDLRYFSPREIANLMGFPENLRFPEKMTHKQQYKLLGNSLNVDVVCYLLTYLLRE